MEGNNKNNFGLPKWARKPPENTSLGQGTGTTQKEARQNAIRHIYPLYDPPPNVPIKKQFMIKEDGVYKCLILTKRI